MAKMGLKLFAWAPLKDEPENAFPVHGIGAIFGKAVSTNMSIARAEGELYADDMLAEYVSEFVSADLTAEVDNIDIERQAILYGARYDAVNGMQCYPDDTPPYGGIGGYQVLMIRGVRKFRAWFFPKAKAALPDWNGTTKGSSISFGTEPIAMKIMAPAYGPWYVVREFAVEAAARAFIEEKLNVKSWFPFEIQAQGNGEAIPTGAQFVEEGGDLEIALSKTPLAIFDNGVDVLSAVADGKYKVTNITAAHTIAIIF